MTTIDWFLVVIMALFIVAIFILGQELDKAVKKGDEALAKYNQCVYDCEDSVRQFTEAQLEISFLRGQVWELRETLNEKRL